MKPLISLLAFALLVPLAAPAQAETGPSGAKPEKVAKTAPKRAHTPAKKATPKVAHVARAGTKDIHAPALRHDDAGHHEPSVTPGVTVSRVSARHAERPSARKLPLLPASAVERVEAPKHEAKPAKKGGKAEAPKASDKPATKASKGDGRKAEGPAPTDKPVARAACLHAPVELVRGAEVDRIALQRCEGGLAPFALERLSVVLRPTQVARPVIDFASAGKAESLAKNKAKSAPAKIDPLPPQIRRVDPGLVERLDLIAEHFRKPGAPLRVGVISGYRPNSAGSQHAHGRAMDIRIEGVDNEQLVAFCKSIPDTGCGYYPNSSFVHVDVRDPGAGHVSWIDASGPGEAPRYVTEWPPKAPKADEPPAVAKEADDEHPAPPGQKPADAVDPKCPPKPQELIDGVKD